MTIGLLIGYFLVGLAISIVIRIVATGHYEEFLYGVIVFIWPIAILIAVVYLVGEIVQFIGYAIKGFIGK